MNNWKVVKKVSNKIIPNVRIAYNCLFIPMELYEKMGSPPRIIIMYNSVTKDEIRLVPARNDDPFSYKPISGPSERSALKISCTPLVRHLGLLNKKLIIPSEDVKWNEKEHELTITIKRRG